jgi:hypothetical protein
MSDDDDNDDSDFGMPVPDVDWTKMMEKILATAKASSVPAQDPLVFVVTGSEVRELFLAMAERYENMLADERRPYAESPSKLPLWRETAKSARWLADHVETDRVFRLGLQDLRYLGIYPTAGPVTSSGYSG